MIFIGDTHNNNNYIMWKIKQTKMENQHLIHVGDFGVGAVKESQQIINLQSFNKFLRLRNITLHVFRGNHDDPLYFEGDHLFSNLKLHPDYTILEIEGKKILGIGGAVSIDRVRLIEEGGKYWPDEKFILDRDFLRDVRGIDILVTHTTPKFIPPINIDNKWPNIVNHFAENDATLCDELILERELLAEGFELLTENNKITHHFYGHFHYSVVTPRLDCVHMCLNIGEFFELPDTRKYEEELNQKYGK